MFRHYTISLCCLLLLAVGFAPTFADSPPWTAWLYDSTNGRMVLVGADGVVIQDFTLPVPQGFDEGYGNYPEHVAVSPDGKDIAYMVMRRETVNNTGIVKEQQFIVYDTVSQSIQVAINLPLMTCYTMWMWKLRADEYIFSEGGGSLAYGYAAETGWEVMVINILTGEITQTLSSDSPAMKGLTPIGKETLIPVVNRFKNQQVTFALWPEAIEVPPPYPSFTWNLVDDSVATDDIFTSYYHDIFEPTGEIIRPMVDSGLPNEAESFDDYQANALQVIDPITHKITAFYTLKDRSFSFPTFVQNGELISVYEINSKRIGTYQLIERDGSIHTSADWEFNSTPLAIHGLSDGYIYVLSDWYDSGETFTNLIYHDSRTDNSSKIWESYSPSPLPEFVSPYFTIVWAHDKRLVPVGPYTPWANVEK